LIKIRAAHLSDAAAMKAVDDRLFAEPDQFRSVVMCAARREV
jgi:hypothetical protein